MPAFTAYLLDKKANPDLKNNAGRNVALVRAAAADSSTKPPTERKRYREIASLLIKSGADVGMPDSKGNTPLSLSKLNQDPELEALLLRAN